MIHAVCYLFGNNDTPTLHGTVTFRSAAHNRICLDVDLSGIPDTQLYGIRMGGMVFPPVAADDGGRIQVTFYRGKSIEDTISGSRVSVFRYDCPSPDDKVKRQTVASGTIREITSGSLAYGEGRRER